MLFKPINFKALTQIKDETTLFTITPKEKSIINVLFYLSSIIYVILQLLTYYVRGIPILMESRLDVYANSGGFGIVGRIVEVTGHITFFLLFYKLFYTKKSLIDGIYLYFTLIFCVISLMLSGSKTSILYVVFYIFFLRIYFLRFENSEFFKINKKLINYSNKIFLFAIIFSLIVIYIAFIFVYHAKEVNPLIPMGQRLLAAGDTYFQAFPGEVIKHLDSSNPLLYIFKEPIGTLRLAQYSDLPKDIGRELQLYHYPDSATSGPNPRYNLIGILFFGIIGQFLYPFIIGVLMSFLRNKLFYVMKKNIINALFYCCIGINLIYLPQDQPYFVGRIFNLIFILPVILILTYFIIFIFQKKIASFNHGKS